MISVYSLDGNSIFEVAKRFERLGMEELAKTPVLASRTQAETACGVCPTYLRISAESSRMKSTSQVKLILSPKQRVKPAASRTRTCTNAAVCIASGECPSRF